MSRTRPAHRFGPRNASWRSRALFVVLGATVCLGIAGTGVAFGYWNSTDSSNPAQAVANSLPQGATPSASLSSTIYDTVTITFAEVSTTSGGVEIPASDYILKRYPAGGGSPVTVTASCSGTGTITCTDSSVPEGTWQYTDTPTYATNWVGIESAKSGPVTVNTAPTVTITYPVNGATYGSDWTSMITGTASAGAGTTIKSAEVAIEDTTSGKWWNGTSFSASSQTFVPVTDTTTWLLSFGAGNLTSGDNYSVVAEATDSLGNIGTSSTVRFTYCLHNSKAPPTVCITYPVNGTTYGANWTGIITGTASSNSGDSTTITGVAAAVEDTTTGKWWNGFAFNLGTETFVAASGNTTWMLGLAAQNLTSGDSYSVIAQATDSTGKIGTSSTVTFTYTALPTVTITYPCNCKTYGANWTGTITGTASAGPGATISAVSVAIEDTSTDKWWNGTSFNLGAQTFVPATGKTAWSLPLAAQNLNWGVTYKVVAQATDSAGNIGTSSAVAFSYKTKKPKVTKVYPRYMGDCGGQCSTGIYWTITGTNFVPGATVSFPSTGPSADFRVVSGSVDVLDSTTIVLRVRDTGATKGQATVVVTNPGEAPAFGSITATGKPDPASLSIIGPSDVSQGAHTTLSLKVSGTSCSTWGSFAVYFSNPGITGGRATCSGGIVSVPITVSSSALTGNSSVTVLVESKDFAVSTNGLTVEVTPRG